MRGLIVACYDERTYWMPVGVGRNREADRKIKSLTSTFFELQFNI